MRTAAHRNMGSFHMIPETLSSSTNWADAFAMWKSGRLRYGWGLVAGAIMFVGLQHALRGKLLWGPRKIPPDV